VLRLTETGVLDEDFAAGAGFVALPEKQPSGNPGYMFSGAIDSAGQIYIGGYMEEGSSNDDIAVWRIR